MGLKTTLMGKPPTTDPSTSESGNHAYDAINSAFSPGFGYFTQGGNMLGNLLGVGGASAQTGALSNFANSGGMQFLRDQGMEGINSNMAAKGALNSGATLKALDKFNQGLASTYLNQYMDQLSGLSKLGLGAGNLVASAGQYSNSTGQTQKPGKQGLLPILMQAGEAVATGGASLPMSAMMDFGSTLGGGLGGDFSGMSPSLGGMLDFSGLGI